IVYTCAARNSAMYLAGEKKRDTMYWNGNRLIVGLLFDSLGSSCAFKEEIRNELTQYTHALTLSQIASDTTVDLVDLPERILEEHYEYLDYDYGECPFACEVDVIADILRVETLAEELQHLMIERPDLGQFQGLYPYRAYLKGVAEFPDEEANPNNRLVMSWDMRQLFDGLVFDGLVTQAAHQVPLMAIRFVLSTGMRASRAGLGELERVIVAVESPNEKVLVSIFLEKWAKAGSRYDERSRSVYTFLDVPDAAEFERCLTYKYQHTKHAWRLQKPGMRLSPREAGELRVAVHAAVMRESGLAAGPDVRP
ncbi:MAG: hypothetical protein WBJ81_01355, partial [Rickettsiales bacterium]